MSTVPLIAHLREVIAKNHADACPRNPLNDGDGGVPCMCSDQGEPTADQLSLLLDLAEAAMDVTVAVDRGDKWARFVVAIARLREATP